jgi:hypothetical protein
LEFELGFKRIEVRDGMSPSSSAHRRQRLVVSVVVLGVVSAVGDGEMRLLVVEDRLPFGDGMVRAWRKWEVRVGWRLEDSRLVGGAERKVWIRDWRDIVEEARWLVGWVWTVDCGYEEGGGVG